MKGRWHLDWCIIVDKKKQKQNDVNSIYNNNSSNDFTQINKESALWQIPSILHLIHLVQLN